MKVLLTFAILIFCANAYPQSKPAAFDPKLLIGKWRSVDDKHAHIEFSSGTETEYYDQEVMSVSAYTLKKDQLTLKDKKNGDLFRYSVLVLNGKVLSLLYLDRGNTLRYKRE